MEWQSKKKKTAERLSFEQRNIILKWYWNFENVCSVKRQWWHEFVTGSPTRLTIVFIRDKSEIDGRVHDVHKQRFGRLCTTISASSGMLLVTVHTITTKITEPFYFNKMVHCHITTEISEATSMKFYPANG